jgi:hypothetical protein
VISQSPKKFLKIAIQRIGFMVYFILVFFKLTLKYSPISLGFATGENTENLKTSEAALLAKVVFFRYLLDNPVPTQDFLDMTLFDWDVLGMSDINEQLVSKQLVHANSTTQVNYCQ